jgi:hypothetical protein
MALESMWFSHLFDPSHRSPDIIVSWFLFIFWSNYASLFNLQNFLDPKIGHLLFGHLSRRKVIEVKIFCLFKWTLFFFLAINFLPYSNIIWRRHKDLLKTSNVEFLNFFEELLDEAIMQILPKDWRIGYQKISFINL